MSVEEEDKELIEVIQDDKDIWSNIKKERDLHAELECTEENIKNVLK